MQIKADFMKVTPEIAEQWLNKNPKNRKPSIAKAVKLAWDIQNGKWISNGATIVISVSGLLLDGQHRLKAIILSQVALDLLVVTGVPDEAIHTIDTGDARSLGDVLGIAGMPQAKLLAGALRSLSYILQEGDFAIASSHAAYEQLLAQNQRILQSLEIATGVRKVLTGGLAVALHYLFNQAHTEKCREYFEILKLGAPTANAVHSLFQKLQDNRSATRKRPKREITALCIKAFNHFVAGELKTPKQLKFNPTDKWPQIRGLVMPSAIGAKSQ